MSIMTIIASLAIASEKGNLDCPTAASAFMAGYAADLLAGDRARLAARYSSRGAYNLGLAAKVYDTYGAIVARYAAPTWGKPDGFSWDDLSYEQLGSSHCLVVGAFSWREGSQTVRMAYSGVLVMENAALRIVHEHENMLPVGR